VAAPDGPMMKMLSSLFDRLLDAMGGVAAGLLALATLAITAEILIRGLGLGSLPWAIEAVEYALLGVTFLAAPWVLWKGAHVRVDILVETMPPKAQRAADLLANLSGVVVCGVIFYYGLVSTIGLYNTDTRIFRVLVVKEWWLFSLIPFSCALMLIEFARRILRGSRQRNADDTPRSEANF
jgi:TRAP-type C4-dicarboxylate transport system permease small subunit